MEFLRFPTRCSAKAPKEPLYFLLCQEVDARVQAAIAQQQVLGAVHAAHFEDGRATERASVVFLIRDLHLGAMLVHVGDTEIAEIDPVAAHQAVHFVFAP